MQTRDELLAVHVVFQLVPAEQFPKLEVWGLFKAATPDGEGRQHYVDRLPPTGASWICDSKAQQLQESGEYCGTLTAFGRGLDRWQAAQSDPAAP